VVWYGGTDNDLEVFLYDGSSILQLTDNSPWPDTHQTKGGPDGPPISFYSMDRAGAFIRG